MTIWARNKAQRRWWGAVGRASCPHTQVGDTVRIQPRGDDGWSRELLPRVKTGRTVKIPINDIYATVPRSQVSMGSSFVFGY